MKETPPYSLAEIRMILAQYLDGALEAERMAEVDALIERFPQYQAEFLKLQTARGLVHDALARQSEEQLHYTKISDGVWKTIAAKLEADRDNQPAVYDAEFVSAYYDGQIPAESAELQAFESQLYGNAEANRLLAEIGQVSEAVRQFGYRLETSCTLDIAAQVMSAYRAEQGIVDAPVASEVTSLGVDFSAEAELLSAYADQELSPRETIEANRLIENNEGARATLGRFTRLSEQIQHVSTQLQAQAPDLWPAVSDILRRSPEEGGLVVSINRKQKLQNIAKIAVPAAAAAVLLLFFLPGARLHSGGSMARSVSINNTQAVAYKSSPQSNNAPELASLPGATLGQSSLAQQRAEMAAPAAMDASSGDLTSAVEKRMPAAPASQEALKPILDPSPQLAAKPSRNGATSDTASATPGESHSPTSEEYLFNALNEQMPDEDISAILGK